MTNPDDQLKSFADAFHQRREAVTQLWLHAVQTSPDFTTPDRLATPQLIDHLPPLFDDLIDCLKGEDEAAAADSNARAHGRHRWEQHFRLDELLRELLLLRRIVILELERYESENEGELPETLGRFVRMRIEHFFEEAIVRSTDQFSEQHEAEIAKDKALLASLHESARDSSDKHAEVASARLRLLRVIAHELRNLLNAATLTSGSLPAEKDAAWRDELQQMLTRSLRQMTALVNQLLDVAPILSGGESQEYATLDLSAFVDQQRLMFEKMAAAKNLSFTARIAPEVGSVVTDEAKLQRIVINLIQNAIKFTDVGGVSLEISRAEDGCLQLVVSDTGPGISAENHQKIFEEFHRLPGTQNLEGTGLGLAIVRELVHQLGGKIAVESHIGEGACFRVTLPVNGVAPSQVK